MSLIKPGTYKQAKIVDYGFTVPKEGKNPSVIIMFEFMATTWDEATNAEGQTMKKLAWFGSFNGEAKQYTVKNLVETFGFAGRTGIEIAGGMGSGAINETRLYDLEIETNEYNGKKGDRIKYVNIHGQTRTLEKLAQADAAKFLGGLGLEADFAEAKQGAPTVPAMKNHAPGAEPSFDPSEGIPF